MTYAKTLLIMLIATLGVACQTSPQKTECSAAKPTGIHFDAVRGGVWTSRDDFTDLMLYIEQLEHCTQP